jgi:CrcB protein
LKNFLYIGVAAALGGWSRWGIGILLDTLHPIFPIGTLTVNLVGGYLIGVSMGAFEFFSDLSPDLKLIINIGFFRRPYYIFNIYCRDFSVVAKE